MVGRTRCGPRAAARPAWCACGAEQVEQVAAFGVVELERMGDAVDDALGDPGSIAALEADVVLR